MPGRQNYPTPDAYCQRLPHCTAEPLLFNVQRPGLVPLQSNPAPFYPWKRRRGANIRLLIATSRQSIWRWHTMAMCSLNYPPNAWPRPLQHNAPLPPGRTQDTAHIHHCCSCHTIEGGVSMLPPPPPPLQEQQ